MPQDPYPITGIITDTDGSTLFTSGTIKMFNTTKDEFVEGTIESDGSFSVDPRNATTDYAVGDKLQIVIYDSNQVKSTWFRHTIAIQAGYEAGTLYLHWTQVVLGDSTLHALIVSNNGDSDELKVDLYNVTNDEKILPGFDVLANTGRSPNLGFKGIKALGGICVIREADTANLIEVTLVVR